jgi:hypothetical protein
MGHQPRRRPVFEHAVSEYSWEDSLWWADLPGTDPDGKEPQPTNGCSEPYLQFYLRLDSKTLAAGNVARYPLVYVSELSSPQQAIKHKGRQSGTSG